MADIPTEAAEAAAKATTSAEVKKPQPLDWGEKAVAALLVLAGLALIGVTLFAFSSTNANFIFKAKEKTTSEPVFPPASPASNSQESTQGNNERAASPATKSTTEVDYADTVVIFALTVGAALALAGGFYSRLRSLKLGALELGFVSEEDKQTAKDAAATKVAAKITDPDKKPAAEAAAAEVAVADLTKAVAMGVQPTEPVITGIADQAAMKVADAIE